jgi:hypothetical protein
MLRLGRGGSAVNFIVASSRRDARALTGYGAAEIVLQLGLGRILATAVGFVAFVANLFNHWPQAEDGLKARNRSPAAALEARNR